MSCSHSWECLKPTNYNIAISWNSSTYKSYSISREHVSFKKGAIADHVIETIQQGKSKHTTWNLYCQRNVIAATVQFLPRKDPLLSCYLLVAVSDSSELLQVWLQLLSQHFPWFPVLCGWHLWNTVTWGCVQLPRKAYFCYSVLLAKVIIVVISPKAAKAWKQFKSLKKNQLRQCLTHFM